MDASLETTRAGASLSRCVLYGLLRAMILLPLLLLAAAWVAYMGEDPGAAVLPISYGTTLLCAGLSGFLTARRRGRQGLLCGLFAGLFYVFLMLIGFFITCGTAKIEVGRLLTGYALLLALSLLGGVLGAMLPAGRARRVRRPKRR